MESLLRPDVLLVFTYAPAGLGHLRVTDALHDGLPAGANSVLLGADDKKITYWHRLMSINPFFRWIMEWFQKEEQQKWFSTLYVFALRVSTGHLYRQMEHLIGQQWHDKKIMVVLSTHFGLAHQIAAIRKRLEKKFNMNIVLVVQVTDATSMKIWYVEGADLIVVPSKKVKTELSRYAQDFGSRKTEIAVLPYPLGKTLGVRLTNEEYAQRLQQYSGTSGTKINVVLPVSGAAVGLGYYDQLMSELSKSTVRFRMYLVISRSMHTNAFINTMKTNRFVEVVSGSSDKEVVDKYEKVYEQNVIAIEIVKPSEQAFKAMLTPTQRGGAILLFMQPIGKQEEDNLAFLSDHKLIPNAEDQKNLYRLALSGNVPADIHCPWRALQLTNSPIKDAVFINWCISAGVFSAMAGRKGSRSNDPELASNGVEQFWGKVDALVQKKL
jgi:hypothetical protein